MLDDSTWATIRLALRRSRVRGFVLLALLRLGEGYLADVAREAGVRSMRVLDALYGDGENYKILDSLIPLGLVSTEFVRGKQRFTLTPLGREAALRFQREMLEELASRRRARN